MPRVTSTEFQQKVGTYSDAAMREPVIITSHNRDKLVLLDVEEYERLKKYDIEEDKQMTEEEKKRIRDRMEAHRHTYEKLAR